MRLGTLMDRRIQVIQATIENNFSRSWNIEALARMANLSPSRLRHLFRAQVGQTPSQYLKTIRMREAEKLLRTTFLTVKEIMNGVGLSNESHFVHEFKKAYGLAPSKYRLALTTSRIQFDSKKLSNDE